MITEITGGYKSKNDDDDERIDNILNKISEKHKKYALKNKWFII